MTQRVQDLSREALAALAREAGLRAVRETLGAGIPVIGIRGGQLFEIRPDGSRHLLKPARRTVLEPRVG